MDETGFACLYCGFDDVEAMAARLTRALSLIHHLMRSRRQWQSEAFEHLFTYSLENTERVDTQQQLDAAHARIAEWRAILAEIVDAVGAREDTRFDVLPEVVRARIADMERESGFMLGQATNNAKRWSTTEVELIEARTWAAWFAAEKDHWLERAALTGQRMGRSIAELEANMWTASDWAAWFAAERDEARRDVGAARGTAGSLQARVVELRAQVDARDARIAELEASQPFPAGYVTGFLNDQDRVCGLEHVAYSTRVQAVERAEYRRPSIPTVAVYALRKVSDA
jgi:chromosome segregation ATPase